MGGYKHHVRLQSCEIVMESCTAQYKMLLFHVKAIARGSCSIELARLKKEEDWPFAGF